MKNSVCCHSPESRQSFNFQYWWNYMGQFSRSSHWLISNLLSRCSSLSCVPLEIYNLIYIRNASDVNVCDMKWANDSDIHPCACGPPLSFRTLYRQQRDRTRSHRGSSGTHAKSTGKGVSMLTDAYTVAYHMLTESFTNWKNEANSLLGLGLRESQLPLSDLCCHALLGRQRRPEDHSDVSCFSSATFFYPKYFQLSSHGGFI